MGEGTLLIRADANLAMGTGHVMRCLALAQAWQDIGGTAAFAMADPCTWARERLMKESVEVIGISASSTEEDARQTAEIARHQAAVWVVVDGYQFGADYQRTLKSAGFKILFVDDYGHAGCYCADLVLNQNVSADESAYEHREPYTRLLLGPQYCMLRREFNSWRAWRRKIAPSGYRVLVTMGGSDPEGVTERAIAALNSIEDDHLEGTVVVGGGNPRLELLERAVAGVGKKKIVLRRDVSNMAELMAWADVAISAAGTTCWEMCLMGLPALLVDLAENQTRVARELDRRGCAIHLGGSHDFSAEKIVEQGGRLLRSQEDRQAMSLRCRELVDEKGARRVVSALRGVELFLRPAQEKDSHLLWVWANDPGVRAAAFSSTPIPWEQHEAWFTSKMGDPDCHLLIAEDGQGRAIGQLRTDWRSSEDAYIDVSVSSECRGEGYGRKLIGQGVNRVLAERRSARLHAFVKPENRASRRSFESAGFGSLGEEYVNGHLAIHYVRTAKPDQD